MFTSTTPQTTGLPGYRAIFEQLHGLCTGTPAGDSKPLMHETVFQQLLLDVMATERPVEFRRFRRLLYQAMVHFRRMKAGDLAGGFAELQGLRQHFPPLSTDVRQLGEAMLTPMLAYYYFRLGDYPTASYYNQQAVALSSTLQADFPVLHLHQIQQQFNLSRIDMARQRPADALATLKELIDYLVAGKTPNLTGTWPISARPRVDGRLLHNQLLDILNELVFLALKTTDLEARIADTVLVDAGPWLVGRTLAIPSAESALRTWWRAYQTETSEQAELFLVDLCLLLDQYPADYDQLKLLLLGRLHSLTVHAEPPRPDYLLVIRQFVNTKLRLSPRLQQYIRSVRPRPGVG